MEVFHSLCSFSVPLILCVLRVDSGPSADQPEVSSVDGQCRIKFQRSSFFCGHKTPEKICQNLLCVDVTVKDYRKQCVVVSPADDYTVCGRKKWCVSRKCVYDTKAPKRADNCLHSQFGGKIEIGGSTESCTSVMAKFSSLCNLLSLHRTCCESCRKVRRLLDGNCPFGEPRFCRTLHRAKCYEHAMSKLCCETCRKDSTAPQSCPFGDRSSWCQHKNYKSFLCYKFNKTCCKTCKQYQLNVPKCQYGDRSPKCEVMKPRDCYDKDKRKTCCAFCHHMRRNGLPQGCEWGDRIEMCSSFDKQLCHDPLISNDCCGYCYIQFLTDRRLCRDSGEMCESLRDSHRCYEQELICCKTCSQLKVGDGECRYGDHKPSCSALRKIDCYKKEKECCDTCYFMETNLHPSVNCKYGDRVKNCKAHFCKNKNYSHKCCFTCHINRYR